MGIERAALICSVNRALLEKVGPHLRLVAAHSKNDLVSIRFYFDGEISDEDRESASCAGTEVLADFPDFDFNEEVIRCDAPEAISNGPDWLTVFARRET